MPVEVTLAQERGLESVAHDLRAKYRGVFVPQTIEALVKDSFAKRAETSRVTEWLVIGAERFAYECLDALVHSRATTVKKRLGVLSLRVRNAGRS